MYLPECLGWALEDENVSTVKIYCEEGIKGDVKAFFENTFANEWKNALVKAEAEYNGIDGVGREQLHVTTCDEGVSINVISLEIRYAAGDFYDLNLGSAALDNALELTKQKFPQVEYSGYLLFALSDRRCGEVFQWSVSSINEELDKYDFLGQAIGRVLSTEEHIWERAEDHEVEDLTFVVTGKLKHFENREEISEYIEDLGATVSGSISKKTSYLINNDVRSKTSKNTKAKELNIPVITESEFIARFGDPDDYDIDVYDSSHFWFELGNNLADAEDCDYMELLDVLYAHAEWIDRDDLRRAAYSLADMAAEIDPDYKETLMEYIAKLESGDISADNDEINVEDNSSLPTGYMEALDAFMEAEAYENKLAKQGVLPDAPKPGNCVMSLSADGFPRVALKAEEGDERALAIIAKMNAANEM